MSDEKQQPDFDGRKWSISPEFQQFLLTILATFIGCLIALCLYNASIGSFRDPRPLPPSFAPVHKGMEFAPGCPFQDREMRPPRKHFKHHPAPQPPRPPKAPETPDEPAR